MQRVLLQTRCSSVTLDETPHPVLGGRCSDLGFSMKREGLSTRLNEHYLPSSRLILRPVLKEKSKTLCAKRLIEVNTTYHYLNSV